MFVAQLGKEGLGPQSIKCYLSAIRFRSIIRGESSQQQGSAGPD